MRKNLFVGMGVLVAASVATAQSSSSSVQATDGAGASAISIEEAKPTENKWGAFVFQETYISQNDFRENRGENSVSDIAAGVSYKLDAARSLEFSQWATRNQTDGTRDNEFELANFRIRQKNSKAFNIGGTDISSDARFYVPVDGYFTEVGRWEGRYGLAVDQTIAPKTTISYASTLRAYAYTENKDGQNWARLYVGPTLTYAATDAIAPYFGVTYEARQYYSGKGIGLDVDAEATDPTERRDAVYVTLGSDFSAGPVAIGAYAEQYHRAENGQGQAQEFNLLNSDEMTYYLNLTASM